MNRLKENVTNVAQRALLEEGVSIENEAAEVIRDCVLEFLSSLSCDSLSVAATVGRRRVSGYDMVESLKAFGFEEYIPPLEVYLHKWKTHSNVCQECNKLFPLPADFLQKEEEELAMSLANAATVGPKKIKKAPNLDKTDMKGNSSSGRKSTANDSAVEAKKGKGRNSSDSISATQASLSPKRRGSKPAKANGDKMQDPEFIQSLRNRMLEAAQHPNSTVLLKLLAKELRLSQKSVKEMFDQMISNGEVSSSSITNEPEENETSSLGNMRQDMTIDDPMQIIDPDEQEISEEPFCADPEPEAQATGDKDELIQFEADLEPEAQATGDKDELIQFEADLEPEAQATDDKDELSKFEEPSNNIEMIVD